FGVGAALPGPLDAKLKWSPAHAHLVGLLQVKRRIKGEPGVGTLVVRIHFDFVHGPPRLLEWVARMGCSVRTPPVGQGPRCADRDRTRFTTAAWVGTACRIQSQGSRVCEGC